MHLGIFGGSFDPVHNAHLALAATCQEQAGLDAVWFTPTAIQPLKQRGPHATDTQRVEMLNLAIESVQGDPGRGGGCEAIVGPRSSWRVCTLEIDRGGVSYTIDTLRQLHVELPATKLFFLIGADALRDVPNWREPAEIFHLATPLVVRRAGQPEPQLSALERLCTSDNQPRQVEMPAMDVSSSEIRRRVATGQSIDHLVPITVASYIARQTLYR